VIVVLDLIKNNANDAVAMDRNVTLIDGYADVYERVQQFVLEYSDYASNISQAYNQGTNNISKGNANYKAIIDSYYHFESMGLANLLGSMFVTPQNTTAILKVSYDVPLLNEATFVEAILAFGRDNVPDDLVTISFTGEGLFVIEMIDATARYK